MWKLGGQEKNSDDIETLCGARIGNQFFLRSSEPLVESVTPPLLRSLLESFQSHRYMQPSNDACFLRTW